MLYTAGSGYSYVAESGHATRPVYVHRLVAYAHGEIDSLADPREVHHRDGCEWVNSPENLQALDHEVHAQHHLHGEAV